MADHFRAAIGAHGVNLESTMMVAYDRLKTYSDGYLRTEIGLKGTPKREKITKTALSELDNLCSIYGSTEVSLGILENLAADMQQHPTGPASHLPHFLQEVCCRWPAPAVGLLAGVSLVRPHQPHPFPNGPSGLNHICSLLRGESAGRSLRDVVMQLGVRTIYQIGKSAACYRALFNMARCMSPDDLQGEALKVRVVDIEGLLGQTNAEAATYAAALRDSLPSRGNGIIERCDIVGEIVFEQELDFLDEEARALVLIPSRLHFSEGQIVRSRVLDFLTRANVRPRVWVVVVEGSVKDCYNCLKPGWKIKSNVLASRSGYSVMPWREIDSHVDR